MKFKGKPLLEEINEQSNSGVEDGFDNNDIDISRSKSGVGVCANVDTSNSGVGIVPTIDENVEEDKIEVSWGFDSNFGEAPYWRDGTIVTDIENMLSVIATFSNMDGLRSTPQYGFSKGISQFKEEGYDATISKLSNNLIGMNAVDMLDKK